MSSIAGVIFSIIISICIPLAFLFYSVFKKMHRPFLLGAITFIISQLLLRMPLLNYLQNESVQLLWLSTVFPLLFAIILGVSAAVFEEMGRYVMMRYFLKTMDWKKGFIFGAGHGGIEAFLLVGLPTLFSVWAVPMTLDSLSYFVAGFERFFAMLLHIGLSIIIWYGVKVKRLQYLIITLVIHAGIDSLVGIIPLFVSPTTALLLIECTLLFTALFVFLYSLSLKRKDRFT